MTPDLLLIGLVGGAGAGKTTSADHLEERHNFVQAAFADGVKRMLEPLLVDCGHDYANLYESGLKTQPMLGLQGFSARKLMQTLGDWGRGLDRNWWVNVLAQRYGLAGSNPSPVHDRIVVSDVRYANEAAWIVGAGGYLVRVHRGLQSVDPHSSENDHFDIVTAATVENVGSLDYLHGQLDEVVAGLVHQHATTRAPQ